MNSTGKRYGWIEALLLLCGGAGLAAWSMLSAHAERSDVLPYFTIIGVVCFFLGVGKGFYLITPALNARYGSALFLIGIVGMVVSVILHCMIAVVACGFVALIGFGEMVLRGIFSRK